VFEYADGTWTNTTVLRGWHHSSDITPHFGSYVMCKANHLVVLHLDKVNVLTYLHVFTYANNGWTERYIARSKPAGGNLLTMSSRYFLLANVIYPLGLLLRNMELQTNVHAYARCFAP
jgi:hypothetical protein